MPESTLKQFLQQHCAVGTAPQRLVLGFSGGVDSTVLLHALLNVLRSQDVSPSFLLKAVHVHHGLSPQADAWAAHAAAECARVGVALDIHRVAVNASTNIEAAARDARYAAFAQSLQAGDALLLAQHQDDQAETVLLRLLRGAGVKGLGAMQAQSAWALPAFTVLKWRPFLTLPKQALMQYAQEKKLVWVEDDSNQNLRYARNFLRHDIVPRLQHKWPALAPTLADTALRLQEASHLLSEVAAELARECVDTRQRLCISALQKLSPAQQKIVLRHWLEKQNAMPPTAMLLEKIMHELIAARDDAEPCVVWGGSEIRRYRDYAYAQPRAYFAPINCDWQAAWGGVSALALPDGRWLCAPDSGEAETKNLTVRYRQGGERWRENPQTPSRELKNIFQEMGVPPWQRQQFPLVFCGDDLVAVVGLGAYARGFSAQKK